MERDLPPQCSPRAGREEVLRWARTSTGHYPGKSSCAPPAGAGLRLGPTTAHGEGGGPTNIAVLTRAPIYILGAPHSFVEGSLFLPQHRKTPSYPSCPVSSEPPPPSRLVRSRVAGHAAGGARPAPSPGGVSRSLCPRLLERSCGWDDAGLESHNLTPPNRGCNLYLGAAGAAGE